MNHRVGGSLNKTLNPHNTIIYVQLSNNFPIYQYIKYIKTSNFSISPDVSLYFQLLSATAKYE